MDEIADEDCGMFVLTQEEVNTIFNFGLSELEWEVQINRKRRKSSLMFMAAGIPLEPYYAEDY